MSTPFGRTAEVLGRTAEVLGGLVKRRSRWRMDGKVVVVTGAGSGIGRELAREAARRGARLALSDIDLDGLARTVDLVRSDGATDVHSERLDVTEQAMVADHARRVAEHFGAVHLVINNAGIAFTGRVEESAYKDIARVMDVDYWGVVHGTKEFLPHLIASGDGHLVNSRVSSQSCPYPPRTPTTPPKPPCSSSPNHCGWRCSPPGTRSM